MIGENYRMLPRPVLAHLFAIGVALGCSSVCFAQQADLNSMLIGRLPSSQVPVEYATIGSVALPIQVLGLDRATGGTGGQIASNQQTGNRNTSAIDQAGRGNVAAIRIDGDDNAARITQAGTNNVGRGTLTGTEIQFELQQNGLGNQADLRVGGTAGTNLTVRQDGNNNNASGSVPGGSNVVLNQLGNGLSADVSQFGAAKNINVLQVRAR